MLELLLCWELTEQDAAIDRGLSTDSDHEEEADERLVRAFDMICIGGFRAAVDKRPVAAFDFAGFGVGVTETRRSSSSVSLTLSGTSETWSSVSSTSRGFYPTSAWHPGHRV